MRHNQTNFFLAAVLYLLGRLLLRSIRMMFLLPSVGEFMYRLAVDLLSPVLWEKLSNIVDFSDFPARRYAPLSCFVTSILVPIDTTLPFIQ